MLSEAIDSFQRDGFVVVPDLLTDDELERYGPAVDAAVARRKRHDSRSLGEKSRYEQSFIQCQNLWEDSPDVRPLTFHQRVGEVAAALIGAEAIRVWHDQALYKEPGGRETDPHQDQPYWPIAEPNTVTAWIPFDGSTLETGAMGYLPGSHRLGIHRFVNIFQGEPGDVLSEGELKEIPPVFVEVPRGGVAFHHGYTFHLAKPNLGDGPRRVHTVIYFADGCTRSAPHPHPSVERDGIPVGAPIAGAVTPIAWPRDDLPERPPPPPTSRGGALPEA